MPTLRQRNLRGLGSRPAESSPKKCKKIGESPHMLQYYSSPAITIMQASSSFMIFGLPISTQHLIPPSRRWRSRILATSIRDSDDRNFGSRIVDDNVFVLRQRIHEMKMVERNYEERNYEAPAGWMD
ncbi:hypothetical protein EJ110_NYTH06688 [Nymphaea thermarum]|nr:hypothetical protein EJ110_NYTH06688 [Nymphaea thermarum]